MNPAEFTNIARAEQHFWWYRGMNRILFELLDSWKKAGNVLEAGCGTGYLAKLLQERYGWKMFPSDLGIEGLRFGRSLGIERLTQANVLRLPFPGNSFDAVISMDVIVHFPRGQELGAFRELARVAKPGALFAIRVSALETLRSRHSEFAHERQRFTAKRLRAVAVASGIEVTRLTYANTLLLPVAFAKFRLWEPLTKQAPESGVKPVSRWLDRLLYLSLYLESHWLKTGFNLPLGQSLILLGRKSSLAALVEDNNPAHSRGSHRAAIPESYE